MQSEKYILAERVVFSSLRADFLHYGISSSGLDAREMFRAVAPNCRKSFLLLKGYDGRYRNPGSRREKRKRTCRQVGAQNKQADRDSKTPVQIEYEKHLQPFEKEEGTREDFPN